MVEFCQSFSDNLMALFVFFVLVLLAASSGAIFKPDEWYISLAKPSWTPRDWVFPLVWSVLYIFIAIAGWLVWSEAGFVVAMAFWAAQWVFNAAWSWLFFGRRRMDQGFYDICLLWVSAAGFIVTAWSHSQIASLLFVPYLAWISTAALLNLTVWRLNSASAN